MQSIAKYNINADVGTPNRIKSNVLSLPKTPVLYYNLHDKFSVNVHNADAIFISIIYSRASILFLCFIGSMTTFNTLTFSSQVFLNF